MNHEILERLLIDRALGQLPEDVEALLTEHLLASFESRKMADQIQSAVSLASLALPRPRLVKPIRLPVSSFVRTDRIKHILALAASFVIGVGISILGLKATALRGDHPAIVRAVTQQNEARPNVEPSAEVSREARALPFWSNRRVYLLTSSASHHAGNRENP